LSLVHASSPNRSLPLRYFVSTQRFAPTLRSCTINQSINQSINAHIPLPLPLPLPLPVSLKFCFYLATVWTHVPQALLQHSYNTVCGSESFSSILTQMGSKVNDLSVRADCCSQPPCHDQPLVLYFWSMRRQSTVGSRAFPVAGPKTWNALLEDVTSFQSEYTFHCQLKMWLSKKSFPTLRWFCYLMSTI